MGTHSITLPDVGEGVAEAELVEWHVKPGDQVRHDDILAAVMTDKATVEIPSSVDGTVLELGAEIGETIAVGAELVRLEVEGSVAGTGKNDGTTAHQPRASADQKAGDRKRAGNNAAQAASHTSLSHARRSASQARRGKPLASPAVRRRALEAGVDLRLVAGSGPAARITQEDLDAHLDAQVRQDGNRRTYRNAETTEIKVAGLRRRIAERMASANARIPHITIVEEVDASDLLNLRNKLNDAHGEARGKLTMLPFIMTAIVRAVSKQPELNAHYDDENELIRQFGAVHIGIATQTPPGLAVPVVRHAGSLDLWQGAAEINRLAAATRDGSAGRDELTGSTITITSLGALGAIATTPIINAPEVAIVGVNKVQVRAAWDGSRFQPRQMMNLSCSFDHRVIDGWDAAVFVKALKDLLETPAVLFLERDQ